MAMKGRGGGDWPVYEDFKPNSEWKQDAHSHNLIISIPGFMKEQLRVSTEARNIIRVRGERLIAGNKWSRFLEDFDVPENSDMDSVRAKFHEGVLTITVPKKTVDKPHEFALEEKKGVETHKDEKHGQFDDRSKEASSSKTKQTKEERAEAESGRSKELGKDEPSAAKDKGKEGKRKQVIESSGVEHGAFTKAVAAKEKIKEAFESSGAEHGAFTKAVKGLAAKDKGKEGKRKEVIESSGVEQGAFTKAVAAKEKIKEASGVEHGAFTKAVAAKEKIKEAFESSGAEHGVKGLAAKDKGKEGKRKEVIESSGAEHGAFTKAMKGLAELNEERQMMVNMGVAVLVIVSFSAYVTYKFVTGDDKK